MQNKDIILDEFRKIFRNEDRFSLEDLQKAPLDKLKKVLMETMSENYNDVMKEALKGVLRERYIKRQITNKDLYKLISEPAERPKDVAVGILQERQRELTDNELCKKYNEYGSSEQFLKDLTIGILREHIREDIEKRKDFYKAWNRGICDAAKIAQKDVLNEFNIKDVLKNYAALICHFDDYGKEASSLKTYLEFCGTSAFTDHDDLGHFGGEDYWVQLEKQIIRRPIFILLAINRDPTGSGVEREIELDEKLRSNDTTRLRLNVILEELSPDILNKLKIDTNKYYFELYKYGIEKTYNDIISSIINHFNIRIEKR